MELPKKFPHERSIADDLTEAENVKRWAYDRGTLPIFIKQINGLIQNEDNPGVRESLGNLNRSLHNRLNTQKWNEKTPLSSSVDLNEISEQEETKAREKLMNELRAALKAAKIARQEAFGRFQADDGNIGEEIGFAHLAEELDAHVGQISRTMVALDERKAKRERERSNY